MSNPGKRTTDDDEVEQLLRAAQDDMLLKLSINSHVARASASAAIDPDLDRRFEALKKPQKPAKKIDDPTRKDTGAASRSSGPAADDDLLARFAALKSSLPSHNRSEQINNSFRDGVEEEEESEDEVEKVINWAIDAARLDPSPPSDDDEDGDEDDNSDDDDDDDSDDEVDNRKKGKRK